MKHINLSNTLKDMTEINIFHTGTIKIPKSLNIKGILFLAAWDPEASVTILGMLYRSLLCIT